MSWQGVEQRRKRSQWADGTMYRVVYRPRPNPDGPEAAGRCRVHRRAEFRQKMSAGRAPPDRMPDVDMGRRGADVLHAGFYQLRDGRIASAKIYREGSAELA